MKDPTQIAAEAAREVRSYFGKPYYPTEYGNDKVLAIIKAAIEKAYEQAVKDAVNAVEACAFGRVEQREKRN